MANLKRKVICSVCNGNGFVRVPFEQSREEQWADCDFCNNQGEVEEEVNEDEDILSESDFSQLEEQKYHVEEER